MLLNYNLSIRNVFLKSNFNPWIEKRIKKKDIKHDTAQESQRDYFLIRQNRQGASQERRRIFHHLTCVLRAYPSFLELTWFWILGHYISNSPLQCSALNNYSIMKWKIMWLLMSKWLKNNENNDHWNVFFKLYLYPPNPKAPLPL